MTDNTNKNSNDGKKFGFKGLVWLGFNYTCGIAFPLTFSQLIFDGSGTNPNNSGMWIYLTLLLGSIIAGITAFGYSKMSKYYSKSNGGTYVFTRSSLGRFFGWFIGILQYNVLPLAISSMILSMISINFKDYVTDWGQYGTLYLNLIGIFIFVLASLIIYFGLKHLKNFINLFGVIKWVTTGFIIICALALIGKNIDDHIHTFKNIYANTQPLTFKAFNNSFVSFFYFYGGFETYSTISKNVKKPTKTMPKAIMVITILTLLFYSICTILFMGALPQFNDNPPLEVGKDVAGLVGIILVISSMISLKITAAIQSGLYASSMLEPLALEGYISRKFARLNNDNVSIFSSLFNMILTVSFTFILVCLPILVSKSDVQYSNIVGFTTLIILLQYNFVIISILKFYFQKKILLKWWEITMFLILSIFLFSQILFYIIHQIQNALEIPKLNASSPVLINDIFSLIAVSLFILICISLVLSYIFIYKPIYKRRINEKPELQAEMDSSFKLSGLAEFEIILYKKLTKQLKDLKSNFIKKYKLISIPTKKNEYKKEYKIALINLDEKKRNELNQIKLNYKTDKKKTIDKNILDYQLDLNNLKTKFLNDLKDVKKVFKIEKKEIKMEAFKSLALKKEYKKTKKLAKIEYSNTLDKQHDLLENY